MSAVAAPQKWNPKKVSWWYERLADWMIANPHRNMKDAAVDFGVTVSYVYQLKNTDTFQAYWAARSTEHSDAICIPISDKAKAVAEQALDHLSVKLTTMGPAADAEFLLDTADKLMKRLGFAASKNAAPAQVNVNMQMAVISADELRAAKAKMYQQRDGTQRTVSDAEVVEPQSAVFSETVGVFADPPAEAPPHSSDIDPEVKRLLGV